MHEELVDQVVRMAQGNPGAMTALCEMVKTDPIKGAIAVFHLDDLQIYGSNIWLCYKDLCGNDAQVLMDQAIDHSIATRLEELPDAHPYTRKSRG